MKQLISDVIGFISELNKLDLLLYFAVLVLVILIVSLIYVIKTSDDEEIEIANENENEELDLNEVKNNLLNTTPQVVSFTNYEAEQEEKAIISYDELIAKNKTGQINYNEENVIDDEIMVKKINLDNIISDNNINKKTSEQSKYEREEAFLEALKNLNKLLN